mgnify:CR=1 FL=1
MKTLYLVTALGYNPSSYVVEATSKEGARKTVEWFEELEAGQTEFWIAEPLSHPEAISIFARVISGELPKLAIVIDQIVN